MESAVMKVRLRITAAVCQEKAVSQFHCFDSHRKISLNIVKAIQKFFFVNDPFVSVVLFFFTSFSPFPHQIEEFKVIGLEQIDWGTMMQELRFLEEFIYC